MKNSKRLELPQQGPAILVGTYRAENSEWIRNQHFYNLPLLDGVNPNDYSVFHMLFFTLVILRHWLIR